MFNLSLLSLKLSIFHISLTDWFFLLLTDPLFLFLLDFNPLNTLKLSLLILPSFRPLMLYNFFISFFLMTSPQRSTLFAFISGITEFHSSTLQCLLCLMFFFFLNNFSWFVSSIVVRRVEIINTLCYQYKVIKKKENDKI